MSNNDKVSTAAAVINQKEYLKKYLNIGAGKDKKKKKKHSRIIKDRLKIIDDNIDVVTAEETLTVNELNDFLTQEDAPQVVGMIDDRPLALRLDDYRKNSKWKLVGSDEEQIDNNPSQISDCKNKNESDSDRSPPRKKKVYDSDISPPRNRRENYDSDVSPPRKNNIIRQQNSDSDASPPRKNQKSDLYSPKNKNYKHKNSDISPSRRNQKLDLSPLRKKNRISPQRKTNKSDVSPQRKKYYQSSKNSDSDNEPRRNQKSDISPPRKKYYQSNKDSDSDASPKRKNSQNIDGKSVNRSRKSRWADPSPPRIVVDSQTTSDRSPTRHKNSRLEISPKQSSRDKYSKSNTENDKRRDKYEDKNKVDYNDRNKFHSDDKYNKSNKNYRKQTDDGNLPGPSTSKKMEKTLDGKTAGLQNARDLKHETVSFKRREDELFKNMTEDVSGMHAAPVIRDRKTGKKRDFVKETLEEFEKLKREKEQKQKYDKWGKGLKQVGDLKERVESDIHEMHKPLARYADDEDLETYLKEQERDGDPMLQYIKKKKKNQAVAEGKPMRPVYDGEFMPNRFGVAPGHRWDGVDRSNGYEKQWFAKENAKKAQEEEIYKWSTEDM